MAKKDNEEKEKSEVIPLISIYLKDGDISYAYSDSDESSDIITSNNLLLCGTLEKIKQELLDLDLDLEDEE